MRSGPILYTIFGTPLASLPHAHISHGRASDAPDSRAARAFAPARPRGSGGRPREGACEKIGFVGFCARGPHPSRRPGLDPGPIPGALGRPRRSNPFSNGCGGRKRSGMGPGSSPGRRCLSGFVPFPDGRLPLRFFHTLEGGDPSLTPDAAAAGGELVGLPRLPREPRLGPGFPARGRGQAEAGATPAFARAGGWSNATPRHRAQICESGSLASEGGRHVPTSCPKQPQDMSAAHADHDKT